MGLAREDDALELGVGEQILGDHAVRQHGPVAGRGMGNGGHGARLHERGGVRGGARHPDGVGLPGRVGAGGAGLRAGRGGGRGRAVCELRNVSPVVGTGRLGGGAGAARACGPGRRRLAEEVRAGHGLDRAPRRHGAGQRLQQVAGVPHRVAGMDARGLLAAPVEDGEPGVEGRAAPRIGAAVDGCGERHLRRRVDRGEGFGPGGIAGNAVSRRDRHQPPARRQHGEGRADVAEVGLVADAVYAGRGREGRVHNDHGGPEPGQAVADGLRVVTGDGGGREEAVEQAGADGGELVEVERRGSLGTEGALGHDRQHAGAGGRLEHHVARADGGGLDGGVGEGQRGGELLQAELFLRTARLGGLERREGLQHVEHRCRTAGARPGFDAHGAAVALEEEDDGGLGRLVGVLPDPCAFGVGAAEGAGHGAAQGGRVEGAAGFEGGKEGVGGGHERVGRREGVAGKRQGGGKAGGGCGGGRRRVGVEHGTGSGSSVERAARSGVERHDSRRSAGPDRSPRPGLPAGRDGTVKGWVSRGSGRVGEGRRNGCRSRCQG